jgi:hypothetical protein
MCMPDQQQTNKLLDYPWGETQVSLSSFLFLFLLSLTY